MARDMVLGVEVALPDGTLMTSLNKMLKNNAGYDLKHLFIGSEGTLGVITRAVLRLFPLPACTVAALCGLGSYAAVLSFLASARQSLGPLMSAFEVMWPDYWTLATERVPGIRKPIAGSHAFYVLVEAQGSHADDAQRFDAWLESQAESALLEDAAVAQSIADVKAFWGTRDAAAEFKAVLGPHASFDIGLPVAAMDAYAQECRSTLAAEIPGCLSVFYGHIADGNMHIVSCVPNAPEQPFEAIDEVVYRLVRRHGGTVSAEHGIGLKKKPYLPYSRTPEELALMRLIKQAIDGLATCALLAATESLLAE
jgi:FAD/FMN-containing dehydrogenase